MVQIIHNSAFSRPSKSGFVISSLVRCDKTIHPIVLKFYMVLNALKTRGNELNRCYRIQAQGARYALLLYIYNVKTDLQSQDLYLVPQKISERSDE